MDAAGVPIDPALISHGHFHVEEGIEQGPGAAAPARSADRDLRRQRPPGARRLPGGARGASAHPRGPQRRRLRRPPGRALGRAAADDDPPAARRDGGRRGRARPEPWPTARCRPRPGSSSRPSSSSARARPRHGRRPDGLPPPRDAPSAAPEASAGVRQRLGHLRRAGRLAGLDPAGERARARRAGRRPSTTRR